MSLILMCQIVSTFTPFTLSLRHGLVLALCGMERVNAIRIGIKCDTTIIIICISNVCAYCDFSK